MNGYDGDAISESELCGDEDRDADLHDCDICRDCELKEGCQSEPKWVAERITVPT